MNAKQYLNQFNNLNKDIQTDLAEIYRLKTLATSITVAQKDVNVQSSGSKDLLGDSVTMIVDIERDINTKISKAEKTRQKIREQIAAMENDTEREVLAKRYLQNMTFERISDTSNISYRHIFRIHKAALNHFEDLWLKSNSKKDNGESC